LDTKVALAYPSDTEEILYGMLLFFDGKTYIVQGNSLEPGRSIDPVRML
jgi:hypothetical protein